MKNTVILITFAVLLGAVPAAAQEPIAAARELYAAAAYEDALDILAKMRETQPAVASTDATVLRAFCLLALGRQAEAKGAIEDAITERPTWVPAEDEVSPRIRTAFREVRRNLLPTVARDLYQSARADFEKKELVSAAAKFSDLIKVLEDPDVAQDQTLADLRLLADGFRTLSASAANVATAAAAGSAPGTSLPNPGESTPPVGTSGAGAPSSARQAASEALLPVTPPEIINQQLPPWRGTGSLTRVDYSGALDLLINEQGQVESASLRRPVHPLYDDELLRVARTWTYKPAMRGGKPIKFQKTLIVRLNNRGSE